MRLILVILFLILTDFQKLTELFLELLVIIVLLEAIVINLQQMKCLIIHMILFQMQEQIQHEESVIT